MMLENFFHISILMILAGKIFAAICTFLTNESVQLWINTMLSQRRMTQRYVGKRTFFYNSHQSSDQWSRDGIFLAKTVLGTFLQQICTILSSVTFTFHNDIYICAALEIDMGVVKYSHNWRQDQLLLKQSFKGSSTDGVQNTIEQKK